MTLKAEGNVQEFHANALIYKVRSLYGDKNSNIHNTNEYQEMCICFQILSNSFHNKADMKVIP